MKVKIVINDSANEMYFVDRDGERIDNIVIKSLELLPNARLGNVDMVVSQDTEVVRET